MMVVRSALLYSQRAVIAVSNRISNTYKNAATLFVAAFFIFCRQLRVIKEIYFFADRSRL